MDTAEALLLKSWTDAALERAKETGQRCYVTKNGQPYALSDEKPERENLMAEVYPGGRIIAWGLAR